MFGESLVHAPLAARLGQTLELDSVEPWSSASQESSRIPLAILEPGSSRRQVRPSQLYPARLFSATRTRNHWAQCSCWDTWWLHPWVMLELERQVQLAEHQVHLADSVCGLVPLADLVLGVMPLAVQVLGVMPQADPVLGVKRQAAQAALAALVHLELLTLVLVSLADPASVVQEPWVAKAAVQAAWFALAASVAPAAWFALAALVAPAAWFALAACAAQAAWFVLDASATQAVQHAPSSNGEQVP